MGSLEITDKRLRKEKGYEKILKSKCTSDVCKVLRKSQKVLFCFSFFLFFFLKLSDDVTFISKNLGTTDLIGCGLFSTDWVVCLQGRGLGHGRVQGSVVGCRCLLELGELWGHQVLCRCSRGGDLWPSLDQCSWGSVFGTLGQGLGFGLTLLSQLGQFLGERRSGREVGGGRGRLADLGFALQLWGWWRRGRRRRCCLAGGGG